MCVCVFNLNTRFRCDDPHKVIGVVTQCLHFLMNDSVNNAAMCELANQNRAHLHVEILKGQISMLKLRSIMNNSLVSIIPM